MSNLVSLIDLPQNYIDELKDTFYSTKGHVSVTMEKRTSIFNYESVKNIVEFLDMDMNTLVGDNFYKHEWPYFPHTDAPLEHSCNYKHFVIPLEKKFAEDVYFIVFDQKSKIGNVTWLGHSNLDIQFEYNKVIHGNFSKNDIEDYVEDAITLEFANKYLPYPLDWYQGLSGNAYKWEPGKIITFPSNCIHCTGKMPQNSSKLGLTLKFKVKQDVY